MTKRLLDGLYAAATQPELWPAVLGDIAEAWNAPRAKLYSVPLGLGLFEFTYLHNLPLAKEALVAAQRAGRDPFLRAATSRNLLVEGNVVVGEALVPRAVLLASDFYRQFWEPLDIGQSCSGVVFDGTDFKKAPTVLSLYRPLEAKPFTARESARLVPLLSHLSRALGVMFHLVDAEARVASTRAAFDALGAAVLVFDAQQRLTFANLSARQLLARGDLLVAQGAASALEGKRVVLAGSQAQAAQLSKLLRQATQTRAGAHFSDAMVVLEPGGAPRCVLHVAPLASPAAGAMPLAEGSAIVFAYELSSISVSLETLVGLFGLTAAEARAALEVPRGGSLRAMAARLDVSGNTLKSQLRAVYAKTMTHRQVDLLKVLLALSKR